MPPANASAICPLLWISCSDDSGPLERDVTLIRGFFGPEIEVCIAPTLLKSSFVSDNHNLPVPGVEKGGGSYTDLTINQREATEDEWRRPCAIRMGLRKRSFRR